MTVATAASMDGYTAYGASITLSGSKQTFDCPAPRAVIADLDVIAGAPEGMNASGYADLIAKIPAGADWLAAEGCGIETIDPAVWETVQLRLRDWSSDPEGVRDRDREATRCLITGLLMTGFAMQAACSSRPASGAEHQFSHLWDMEHHVHNGEAPSHGFKVGIGSLASIALYEQLLNAPLEDLDVEAAVAKWPTWVDMETEIADLFDIEELAAKAREESRAKHPDSTELRSQLTTLRSSWPELRTRIREQLIPYIELQDKLRAAGAPSRCEEIGISPKRLDASYHKAYHIRRRFTVLDLAKRTGLTAEKVARNDNE
jgi:glycerol-1-phosphate dehydrogenase [NAD(P)+]